MTRHPVKLEQVPPELREGLPVDDRGRVDRPRRELRAVRLPGVPRRTHTAARGRQARRAALPDAAVCRLEAVVARLSGVGARPGRRRRIPVRAAPPLLVRRGDPDRACCAGSRSGGCRGSSSMRRRSTPATCRRRSSPSPRRSRTCASTAATLAPGTRAAASAATRFDYLYGEDELREWVPPLRELSSQAEETYAFFNNNNQTNGVAQAPAGAQLLRRLLDEEHVASA